MRKLIIALSTLILSATAYAADFTLMSPAFQNNQKIPTIYTCNGDNISPPLKWSNAPANTKSFVLSFSSPDWITETVYLWFVFNIPADVHSFDQGASISLPDDMSVGMNFYDEKKYHGPCPPDERVHTYVFTLYALDTEITQFSDGDDPEEILNKMKPHILSQTGLKVTFQH